MVAKAPIFANELYISGIEPDHHRQWSWQDLLMESAGKGRPGAAGYDLHKAAE